MDAPFGCGYIIEWEGGENVDDLAVAVLKLYAERKSLSVHDISNLVNTSPYGEIASFVSDLRADGYLDVDGRDKDEGDGSFSVNTRFRITHTGVVKLRELERAAKSRKHKLIMEWLHIALTLIAVVISIIALLKQ